MCKWLINLSPSIQAKDRLSSIYCPVPKPVLDATTQSVICPQSGAWAVSPPETKSQKVWIFPHTSCRLKYLFYSYYTLNLKLFRPDSQVYPGIHKGVTAHTSVGSLLLHICTSSSTNRTTVGFEFTWLSFILMSQYRVTAISYPPRVWLCFKNPK